MIDEWKDRAAHRPLEDRVGSVTLSSQALNEALHPRPETDWPLEEEAEQAEAPSVPDGWPRLLVDSVDALNKEEDCGWSPDACMQLRRINAAVRMMSMEATQPTASPEQAEAPSVLKEQLRKANQQFVDVSVALMKYVPESEAAAKSALQQLGDAHGYGWCQSALGKMWDVKHGCAPRGSMGVTVKDCATQPTASNAGEREAWKPVVLSGPCHHICWMPDDEETPEERVKVVLISAADYDRACAALATRPPAGNAGEREAWKEAAIAWEVCASLHRQWAKGKDALFTTRQADFVKHAADARTALASKPPAVPDGYQLVMVPKIAPGDEPDWDECIRQAEEATGIKVERHTLSIVIREVRRWIASKPPAGGQKPVAWQVLVNGTWMHCSEFEANEYTSNSVAQTRGLYTAPQPEQVAQDSGKLLASIKAAMLAANGGPSNWEHMVEAIDAHLDRAARARGEGSGNV